MDNKTLVEVADKTSAQLADSIKSLTHAFESVAPQAWHIMVTRQRVDAWSQLIMLIATIIVSIILIPIFIKKLTLLNKLPYGDKDTIKLWVHSIVIGSIGFIATVLALCKVFNISDIIQQIMMPEYFAVQEMIKLLGK
jgi:hypothetical protein